MSTLKPIQPELFFTRDDASDPRLGELARDPKGQIALIGYPDDQGIKLNGGRIGAALGPTEIRRWLYRMTPHPRLSFRGLEDLGDLPVDAELGQRHALAQKHVEAQLKKNRRVMSFGGGNDYAYPDGMALLENAAARPLVINVDAHLDVRDLKHGLTSGTPFYRLLESGKPFDFLELGIQTHCNARAHWDYVEKKGGRILTVEELRASDRGLTEAVQELAGDWFLKARPTFLALDMDVFAWPFARGTSAAWPLGLPPEEFDRFYKFCLKRLDVRVLGIYETSPILDEGGGTARLAAQWAHGFLHDV